MKQFEHTNTIKAGIIFIIISAIAPLSLSAQKLTDNNIVKDSKQLSIGIGYNFRKVPGYLESMKPFEVTANYSINNRHSFYITLPLYIKNRNSMNEDDNPYSSQEFLKLKRRLYGINLGYDYHFIQRRNFSEFIGIGFDYYRTKERIEKMHRLINETAPQAGLEPDGFETFFDYATAEYEPNEMYKAGIIPDGYLSTLMECSYSGDYFCFTSVRCKNDSVHSDTTDYYRICKAVTSEPNLMVLDTYYYTRDTLRQLNSDFNILQWISLLFVFIVLLVSSHFKVCQSLLGFMPIVLSWVIVLGAMVLFNMKFNLISIIISTFIFGIGVDYSIFVMSGLVSPEGNKLQYHKTAILFSAAILIITVGSMLFAQHPAIRSVGFSTLVGLVSAVVLSYVVLPAIYRRIRK